MPGFSLLAPSAVTLAPRRERFLSLSAELNVQDWTLLGALASEQALPQTVITVSTFVLRNSLRCLEWCC